MTPERIAELRKRNDDIRSAELTECFYEIEQLQRQVEGLKRQAEKDYWEYRAWYKQEIGAIAGENNELRSALAAIAHAPADFGTLGLRNIAKEALDH